MDEQDSSHLNTDDKIMSGLLLHETEPEKMTSENNSEAQLTVHQEVYGDSGTDNTVITVIANETENEVYIYDRNEIESAPAENATEYVQVCDSNSTYEEVNNSDEKIVNVDGIEEEEEVLNKNEKVQDIEVSETRREESEKSEKVKEENTTEDGNQLKNFKNVILEDWEVEVPQVVENHESENCTELVVEEEPTEVIAYSSEDTAVVDKSEPQEVDVDELSKDENPAVPKENSKEDNETVLKENSKEENPKENSEGENPKENSKEGNSKENSEDEIPNENSVNIPKENSEYENPKENSEEERNETIDASTDSKLENSANETPKDGKPTHSPSENSLINEKDPGNKKDGITPQLIEKRLETLKCPKSVTKEEIVKILDDSSERVIRPIVGGKDLFFSIELTKRLNQKLTPNKPKTPEPKREKHNESDSCNNNNTVDDRQKIVEILEADEIKDWKSTPSKSDLGPKENGNDMDISKAIKLMEESDSNVKAATKPPRKTPLKKLKLMDKELERTLALQQLREEFPSTRKRSRTSKKVNHVPFLASTVLEKAMTSPEVTTALKPGPPRRRPCYLPENIADSKSKDIEENVTNSETPTESNANSSKTNSETVEPDFEIPAKSIPNPIVKTYSVKRKSTDAESEIKTTLEAVAKALTESSEEVSESKPKKQKTVIKENKNKKILIKKKRKLKPGVKGEKMKSELEKLLGDEGAVRMLYDTQHGDSGSSSPKKTKFKTTSGRKEDLVLKTKLVKNAVMRLSGMGADGVVLRRKRRSNSSAPPAPVSQEEEPIFTSTPNIVLYKPKKKQRAEASRILYRHSSSESFDSSEGYRRTSFDAEGSNAELTNNTQVEESEPAVTEGEKSQVRGKSRKSEILKKRLKKLEKAKEKKTGGNKGSSERLSTDSLPTGGSRLNLSNVPVRKSSRPRVVSKKYSIWSSTSMDSLSVESLGLKKLKRASTELGKKLNGKELTILQYEHLVQVVLTPTTTTMKNSFNSEVLQELIQVFNYLSKEESCRAVLLSSRGTTFCQGIDINRIISFSENEKKKGVSQLVKSIREFVTCLATFKKLLIAGVQGAAIGLGVTLLPYCDLIISSDTASFFTPYVKLGQAPEGAPIHTFPLINRQLVSELLFKSHKMTAAEALKHGLITQIIPEERFEEDLIMLSRNMASQPVQGMQSIKFLLRKSEQRDVSEALQAEGELLEEHWNSSECLNNMIKFINSGELQLKQPTVG